MTIANARSAPLEKRVKHGLSPLLSWSLLAVAMAVPSGWWLRHQRSVAVRSWAPGAGDVLRAGSLRVRVFGRGDNVILLLHGIIASGDSFGATYDDLGRSARVVVPDLLGFGGSMGSDGQYDAAAHVAALDAALAALDLDRRPTTVVGHSMGGALAIRWAATHPDRTRAVVTFGAPLYRTREEADQRMGAMGPTVALLAGAGPVPRAVCAWTCHHRAIASWLVVGSRPDLPIPIARSGVNHTWASYSDSLESLVRDGGWAPALQSLAEGGIPVVIAEGAQDPVPVPGRSGKLARRFPSIRHEIHEHADHLLPLTDTTWCRSLIEEVTPPDRDAAPVRGEAETETISARVRAGGALPDRKL